MKIETLTCRTEVKAAEKGAIEGYASVFGGVDFYQDTIEPSAFDAVLEKGEMPRMFFNHDSWGLPIGRWDSIAKDAKGLYVKGRLNLALKDAAEVYEAVKFGSLDGLSIGFRVDEVEFDEKGIRHIKSIANLPEISVVTFPADKAARVGSVKSTLDECSSITDFERFLRDAGGFSRNDAKAAIAKARQLFSPERDARQESLQPAIAAMRTLLNSF